MASPATSARTDRGDDATPERLRHARVADVAISRVEIYTTSGQKTGQRLRRLQHPIDNARDENWITDEQHAAGCRIRALMDGARTSPRITSRYLAAVDGEASSGLSSSERREYCQKSYARAQLAIRARERKQFISWLEDCETQDMSVRLLGELFTPIRHRHASVELGKYVLRSVTADLVEYFGY